MSVKNFIPTIWSDLIFRSYDKKAVFAGLCNREYEGEIKALGDSVRVTEIGDMTASDYTGTVTYTEADDAQKVLQIDQKKYIAKKIDDVDAVQVNPKLLGEYSRKAGIGIADVQDQYLAALYTQAGITDGSTGSPDEILSTTILHKISEMSQAFDENNVPMVDRVAVVHPWFIHKLRLAGVATRTDNTDVYNSGIIAEELGWTFYMSNNASHSAATWYANYFFIKGETIALADQLVTNEAVRLEGQFGDGLRWLNVFGAKVMAPESFGIMYNTNGAT